MADPEFEQAWATVHDDTPEGWYVGKPGYEERYRQWSMYAFEPSDKPVPASSGQTSRHRLNRGGHRQANSALYRTVIVRMRFHQPTIEYLARRTAEGKTKAEIIRCLKRYVAREVWAYLHPERRETPTAGSAT